MEQEIEITHHDPSIQTYEVRVKTRCETCMCKDIFDEDDMLTICGDCEFYIKDKYGNCDK